jgi:hypothetical protein
VSSAEIPRAAELPLGRLSVMSKSWTTSRITAVYLTAATDARGTKGGPAQASRAG